jgi:hypothetical protein
LCENCNFWMHWFCKVRIKLVQNMAQESILWNWTSVTKHALWNNFIKVLYRGSVTRFSTLGFFHQNICPGPLIKGIKPFRIGINSNSQRYSNFLKCMRCHGYRMHDACGVKDIACTKKNLRTTSKSENHMQNSNDMQKNDTACHWHRMQNMTPHARLTNDSNGPGSL